MLRICMKGLNMQSTYLVLDNSYTKHAIVACQYKEDALNIAQSMNPSCENLEELILQIPYICDPHTYNINDIVQTAIVSTQSAYQDTLNQISAALNPSQNA